jgi:hypothetical protein
MHSSSGNGTGIDVSLHKVTILKGMLPKLKSSKCILVYRSSLGTFLYTLVHLTQVTTTPVDFTKFSVKIRGHPTAILCVPISCVKMTDVFIATINQ